MFFASTLIQLSVVTLAKMVVPALLLILAPVMWDGQEQSVKQLQVGVTYLVICLLDV